jgi:uncharacterized protein (TIGR00730 family)
MKSIAIFCGSSKGNQFIYTEKTKALGAFLAERGIEVIYGAGNVGLMGVVADAALENGGKVLGSIPHFLKEMEVCHTGLTEIFVVDSMHERKQIMAERADGFLILPGGFGTLDEFFEILTWKQLHLHQKPIGLLNWNGYYDHLLAHFEKMIEEGFLKPVNMELLVVASEAEELLEKMKDAPESGSPKWIGRT